MQAQSRVSEHLPTSFLSSPSSSVACESTCSLDALERLVNFTGAGADACLYGVNPPQVEGTTSAALTASAEGLRYWLNPSVRARQTTATCEITNLGPPFFAATSTSVLRISATPLFVDGRCFPTRCVVSLATSAQRLDGVSLRPVVVTEWNLTLNGAVSVCSTTVPLRTLYHLVVLISSPAPATDVKDVRLYLQLRFMGCSDDSDTHRIAALRLRYEQLGPAAEVLPQLLQRRQRSAVRMMLPPSSHDVTDYSGDRVSRARALREEMEVGVATSSRTCRSSGKDVVEGVREEHFSDAKVPCTPTSPLPSTRVMSDGSEDATGQAQKQLLRSPPRRSATMPRAERSLSADRSSSSWMGAVGTTEDRDGPRLIRVDRVLRIPPPPPKPTTAAGSAPSLFGSPWPPRKVRTIVLAPSISPSLCSSSAGTSSRGSSSPSPPSRPVMDTCSSTESHSPTSLTSTPRCRGAESRDREGIEDVGDSLMPPAQQNLQGRFLESTKSEERTSSPASAVGPSSQRRRCHESSSVLRHISSAEAQEVAENNPDTHPHLFAPQQLCSRSDPAVLWAATSLLGTLPCALVRGYQSRSSTPAASVASSCAPSCNRSARAMSADSGKEASFWQMRQSAPSRSFLDSSACAHHRDTRQTPQQETSWRRTPLSTLDPNTSSRCTERTIMSRADSAAMTWTCSAKATTAFLPRWRRDEGTHVSPQLHPPRPFATASPSHSHPTPLSGPSLPLQAVTHVPLHRPTSAFVPRLLLHSKQRSREAYAASSTQRGEGMITINRSSTTSSSTVSTTTATSAPPPYQNRSLWSKAAAPVSATSPLNAGPRRSATADSHVRRCVDRDAFSMSSAALSLMPSSWLRDNANVLLETSTDGAAEKNLRGPVASRRSSRSSTAPPPSRRAHHVPSLTRAAVSEHLEDALSVVSGSSAPLPPPSVPPPQSCALFQTPASTQASPLPSPSSSNSRSDTAPVLPLQEAHHRSCNRNGPRQRNLTQSGGVHSSSNATTYGHWVVETFAVWKHHASRRGVGRRWLRIEWPSPSPSTLAATRFRIALDKAHPSMLTRASVLLGHGTNSSGNSSTRTANPSCEVCIRQADTLEAWCGLRAYHSGMIHQSKVHRAECCLVIRCNAQLVTAVELESTEALEAVQRLLSNR
ncbi:hypothetical protein MNV84_08132 [Leishmania braziliensis]|nr:hypothetical protein MNV84_08132 [Leishmania braziliensis]